MTHRLGESPSEERSENTAEQYLSRRAPAIMRSVEEGLKAADIAHRERPFYKHRQNSLRRIQETVSWETYGESPMLKEIEYKQKASSTFLGKVANWLNPSVQSTCRTETQRKTLTKKIVNPDTTPYVEGMARLRLYTRSVDDVTRASQRYQNASAEGRSSFYAIDWTNSTVNMGSASQPRMKTYMANRIKTITDEEISRLS